MIERNRGSFNQQARNIAQPQFRVLGYNLQAGRAPLAVPTCSLNPLKAPAVVAATSLQQQVHPTGMDATLVAASFPTAPASAIVANQVVRRVV